MAEASLQIAWYRSVPSKCSVPERIVEVAEQPVANESLGPSGRLDQEVADGQ